MPQLPFEKNGLNEEHARKEGERKGRRRGGPGGCAGRGWAGDGVGRGSEGDGNGDCKACECSGAAGIANGSEGV